MLSKSTLERLQGLKIPGFIDALVAQTQSTQYATLSFEERMTLLVDAEFNRRVDLKTRKLLRDAKLPNTATLEDVDFLANRGLSKSLLLEVVNATWLSMGSNIIITGPSGTGKTFIASVIANALAVRGYSVRYQKTYDWILDLQSWVESRRLSQSLTNLRRRHLLILDEWLLDRLDVADARLLLELVDSRYLKYSCLFISQFPVSTWHDRFADPTVADAILDRIVHGAIRFELSGESMRKLRAPIFPTKEGGGDVASLR